MKHHRNKTGAFTLIELLTVIAIIGILAGILVPTVGMVRNNATIATSKARLSQYLSAIQSFKSEYKYYPFSSSLDSDGRLDLSVAANSEIFIEALSARKVDSLSTMVSVEGNRRRIQFYTFGADEIYNGAESSKVNTVIDGFENNQIFIAFDHDNDGEVKVPDPEGGIGATKGIRSQLTAYVEGDPALGSPSYSLYE